jgi:hypothetical protein
MWGCGERPTLIPIERKTRRDKILNKIMSKIYIMKNVFTMMNITMIGAHYIIAPMTFMESHDLWS